MKLTDLTFLGTCGLALLSPLTAMAATYYVAPAGSDTATGSLTAPWASFDYAQSVAVEGDTVYFRGGTYSYTTATATCGGNTGATVDSIVLSKSGTAGNPIKYWAYPGEQPVFDFSGVTDMTNYNCRHTGIRVTGSWLHLKGLELKGVLQLNNLNHESWCLYVYGGSNNMFELLDAHHNMGPGFFVQRGGNNTFLNCDSHENEDTLTSNGDGQSADGFGCHPNRAGDTGNVFRGCRAWWNSDDNWDFINAAEACTVENSWAWYAGYKPDALSGGRPVALSAGNGNGFKGGGYGMPPTNVPATTPLHIIRFNAAFFNKANGVYANHSPVSVYFYNNTSYNNGSDFNMLGVASDGSTSISVGILRNNLAFAGALTSNTNLGGLIDDQYNSWDSSMGLTVSSADFQSVAFAPPASCPAVYTPGGTTCVPPTDTTSFAGMASARQADGSLPYLPFLRLVPGGKLIDKGVDVGMPYNGAAPDLGAFETDGSTGGSGGTSSTSGTEATGGSSTTGGTDAVGGTTNAGGTNAATGGNPGTGGTTAPTSETKAAGGTNGDGGTTNAGGTNAATGGNPGTGGTTAPTSETKAIPGTGGTTAPTSETKVIGGSPSAGGNVASNGGNSSTGGVTNASANDETGGTAAIGGGSAAIGGAGTTGGLSNVVESGTPIGGLGTIGGTANAAGTNATMSSTDTAASNAGAANNTGSCGCRVAGAPSRSKHWSLLALISLLSLGSRRRRALRVSP